MELVRVVFEKGLEVRRDEGDKWLLQSVADGRIEASPSVVTATYGVRPVLWAGDEIVKLASTDAGLGDLETALHGIFLQATFLQARKRKQQEVKERIVWDVLNASYTVDGICYHCQALAEWYARTSSVWVNILQEPNYDSDITAGGAVHGYHEFAALVVTAVRC